MLVAKCERCNNIYDMNMQHRKEGNKTRIYSVCDRCGAEKLSHIEVGDYSRSSNNKED